MYAYGLYLDSIQALVLSVSNSMSKYHVTFATRRSAAGPCPFCQRPQPLTFHHLIPRKLHRRRRYQRTYTREALGNGIYTCRDCHDAIHRAYDEQQLATAYASPEAIDSDPLLRRHFAWLSRQRRDYG
jgi:hypothetical protein